MSRALLLVVVFGSPLFAGHSRFPYLDGGRSPDGRYSVSVELVKEPAAGKSPVSAHWRFTWKDAKTGAEHSGRLEGLRGGTDGVFDPVHGHVFVAPVGETFAVWNPNVAAPTSPPNAKWPDLAAPEARDWPGFSHRLTVYSKAGEVVKRLDLKDLLGGDDWQWLFCYGRQVYWQACYPGLTRDNAPRVGYALFRISPDQTVLETLVGPTDEAARLARERGVTVPAPRPVRVDLTTGKFLDAAAKVDDPDKVPGRPFKGDAISGGRGKQALYVPSADPVRVEGRYADKP